MPVTFKIEAPTSPEELLNAAEQLAAMAGGLAGAASNGGASGPDAGDKFQPAAPENRAEAAAPENKAVEPAPVAPPPAVEPGPKSDNVDARGLPWDERIHAGTKGRNQDGTWKKRRGVDPAEVERVEAELLGAPEAAPEPAPVAPPPSVFAESDAELGIQPQAPLPPSGSNGAPSVTFPALLQRIARDGVENAAIKNALAAVGVPSLPLLGSDPENVRLVWQMLFPEG